MAFSTLTDYLPLWGLFLAVAGLVLLAIELGYRVGTYRRLRSEEEREGPVGAIVAATLGLLAFVLAFTFGLAASRFDARRQMVVKEANAIGTTFLRAGMLPDENRQAVRSKLIQYVEARLEVIKTQDIDTLFARTEQLHGDLWREAEIVGRQSPDSFVVGLFIQALNETIDVHAERVLIGLQSRLPSVLWVTLYSITFLTMAGVGYHEGLSKSKRSIAILVLVLSFSAVMTMIADLDRPQDGYLTIGQQAMVDVLKMMNESIYTAS